MLLPRSAEVNGKKGEACRNVLAASDTDQVIWKGVSRRKKTIPAELFFVGLGVLGRAELS